MVRITDNEGNPLPLKLGKKGKFNSFEDDQAIPAHVLQSIVPKFVGQTMSATRPNLIAR